MRVAVLFSLLVVAGVFPARGAERIIVGEDGSIAVWFRPGSSGPQRLAMDLGLPRLAALRRWRENQALLTEWLTNGVRYTHTALMLAPPSGADVPANRGRAPVLLVNIEGENTNSDYAEASASLAITLGGKPLELELKNGLLWRLEGETRILLGAIEIPDSGIQSPRGEALRFSGNMPPSIKGSMTLKIPLSPLTGEEESERLRDLDFAEALRHARKPASAAGPNASPWLLVFAVEGNEAATNAAPALRQPGR